MRKNSVDVVAAGDRLDEVAARCATLEVGDDGRGLGEQ